MMDNDQPDKRSFNGKHADALDDALEAELLPLERRLLADGNRWAQHTSATELTAWIQTLPAPTHSAQARLRSSDAHDIDAAGQDTKEAEKVGVFPHQSTLSNTRDAYIGGTDSMERLRSFTSEPRGRRRALSALATVTVVAVVALMAALFFGHGFSHGVASSPPASGTHAPTVGVGTPIGSPSSVAISPTASPSAPGSYPGPQAAHITYAVTAHHIDQYHNPIGADTHFAVGENFFVVVTVKGLSATQPHTISVVWLLNGATLPPLGGSVRTVTSPTGSVLLAFGVVYSGKGTGAVNIYWDPATEPPTGNQALGQTVIFTIS